MRRHLLAIGLMSVLIAEPGWAQNAAAPKAPSPDDQYVLGPDSKPQPGVPQGKTFEFTFEQSKIFPGTKRKITVYVPAQYRGDKPACVYVGLDSLGFEAPVVFDNLIHKREMPITIGIGVSSGAVDSVRAPANSRYNRSYEFDGMNDNLARFLLEEVFPEIERRKTPDGLPILLSKDPNDRAAGGGSTGGIGSFTLAWERPDAFRRVFTAIGTFVGMRGGDSYGVLVRKTEPKPIRIFMQDGSRDGLPGYLDEVGDWWMSNQTMQRSLEFAGYQLQHVFGEGSHSGKHATAIFPDAMRWLWKDWPQPIAAGTSQNKFFQDILPPGTSWEPVSNIDAPIAAQLSAARQHSTKDSQGREYFTEPAAGKVWLKTSDGKKQLLDSGLKSPTAIALSPDELWLTVAESETHWGYSYRVQADGSVQYKQRLYWFHVDDDRDESAVGGWVSDRDGRLYAATGMGVQVFDHNGRSRAIMPLPHGEAAAVAFGGEALDWLYVRCTDGKVFRRKLKVSGFAAGSVPIEVPNWNAG